MFLSFYYQLLLLCTNNAEVLIFASVFDQRKMHQKKKPDQFFYGDKVHEKLDCLTNTKSIPHKVNIIIGWKNTLIQRKPSYHIPFTHSISIAFHIPLHRLAKTRCSIGKRNTLWKTQYTGYGARTHGLLILTEPSLLDHSFRLSFFIKTKSRSLILMAFLMYAKFTLLLIIDRVFYSETLLIITTLSIMPVIDESFKMLLKRIRVSTEENRIEREKSNDSEKE